MQESQVEMRCERTRRAAETAQQIDETVVVTMERGVDWVGRCPSEEPS